MNDSPLPAVAGSRNERPHPGHHQPMAVQLQPGRTLLRRTRAAVEMIAEDGMTHPGQMHA